MRLVDPTQEDPARGRVAHVGVGVGMTCAHSPFMLAQMIHPQDAGSVYGVVGDAEAPGRVLRRLTWDNEPGTGRGKATKPATVVAGTLATEVVLLAPEDPESEGVVEQRNEFSETSSLPGGSSPHLRFAATNDATSAIVRRGPFEWRRRAVCLGSKHLVHRSRRVRRTNARHLAQTPFCPLLSASRGALRLSGGGTMPPRSCPNAQERSILRWSCPVDSGLTH